MGQIKILEYTTKTPIQMIGACAGVCWGANTEDKEKNIKRAWTCLENGHMRTSEFPDVYMIIDGYSARVLRELYTHIGGMPTRLQASTRYIDYEHGFNYIVPPSVKANGDAMNLYYETIRDIQEALKQLNALGIPREDSANLLPLGMKSKMIYKVNLRTLIEMSHQRECSRAYWEFRQMFGDMKRALCAYSSEWKELIDKYFMSKCEYLGNCPEAHSCGRMPKKE